MNIQCPSLRLAQRLCRSCQAAVQVRHAIRSSRPMQRCGYSSTSNPQRNRDSRTSSGRRYASLSTLVAGAGLAAFAYSQYRSPATAYFVYASETRSKSNDSEVDTRDSTRPRYRLAEVRKHDASSPNPWVVFEDKVYDITDWIPAHPGGSVILRAAGGSIDQYWDIFSIHKTQYVYDILEQYLIGYVDVADLENGKPASDAIEDPFADDPIRHRDLLVRTARPQNAETPGEAMSASFITPNDLFYVRNHMWVPTVKDPNEHVLTVELEDGTTKEYTLEDLKTRFKPRTVTAALQCSGNRRKDMSEGSGRMANGLQWSVGAISNASWEGVVLADVLADAGLDVPSAMAGTSEAKHVQFSGMEAYGASIPIKKAIDPQGDVLLAYGMNGQPLPRDHGFPLRAIVPGHVAARSVKWLKQITLSDEESSSQWQRRDYKCFGPNQTEVDWDAAPAIQELPVQSAITTVKLGEWKQKQQESADRSSESRSKKVTDTSASVRPVTMSGYAYSGGGRSIIRVDISLDDGKSWTQAKLLPDCQSDGASGDGKSDSSCLGHGAWSWQRWRFDGDVPLSTFTQQDDKITEGKQDAKQNSSPTGASTNRKNCTTLVVKATDESYNTQPESHSATWNIRGNLATAWHRVKICADCSPGALNEPPKKEQV